MENLKYGIDPEYGMADNALREYNRLWSDVAEAYKNLGLRPLKTSDLKNIFIGENFVKDIRLEDAGTTSVGGINLSKEELRKIIDVGGWELTAFIKATSTLAAFMRENRNLQIRLGDYEVVSGDIVFNDAENTLKKRYTLYAKTPKQIAVLTALREVCSALNDCGNQMPSILASEQYILYRNGYYSVNPEGMRRI